MFQQRHRNQLLIAQALRNIRAFLQVIPRLVVSLLVAETTSEIAQPRRHAGQDDRFLRDLLHQTKAQGRGGKFASPNGAPQPDRPGRTPGEPIREGCWPEEARPARLGWGLQSIGPPDPCKRRLLFRSGSAGHRNREKPAEQAANQKPRVRGGSTCLARLQFASASQSLGDGAASGLVAYLIRSAGARDSVRRPIAHQR